MAASLPYMLSDSMPSAEVYNRAINAFNNLKERYNNNVCFFRRHGDDDFWSMIVPDKFSLFITNSEVYTLHTARVVSQENTSFPFQADSLDEVLSKAASRFPAISP